MEPCPLESLLTRRSALQQEIGATRAALQRAAQRDRYVRLRGALAWHLSPVQRDIILIIYMLAQDSPAPAAVSLQHLARRRKWPQKPVETLEAMTENLFIASEPRRLVELSDLRSPAAPAAMKVAALFWVEWCLAAWVGDANQRKGIAPSTGALLQELERRRLELPEASRFRSRGGSAENKARVWALQWRRRWGARLGRVRVREDISAAEMRAKVLFFS